MTRRRRAETSMSHRETLDVRIAQLDAARDLPMPAYQSDAAAGLDLLAAVPADAPVRIEPRARMLVPTGLRLQLPHGTEGQVRPRSGLALRYGVTVLNAPGTIDSDFRGEVQVILVNLGADAFVINRGDRIAQLIIAPVTRAILKAAPLDQTERGDGGFGSTGAASEPTRTLAQGALREPAKVAKSRRIPRTSSSTRTSAARNKKGRSTMAMKRKTTTKTARKTPAKKAGKAPARKPARKSTRAAANTAARKSSAAARKPAGKAPRKAAAKSTRPAAAKATRKPAAKRAGAAAKRAPARAARKPGRPAAKGARKTARKPAAKSSARAPAKRKTAARAVSKPVARKSAPARKAAAKPARKGRPARTAAADTGAAPARRVSAPVTRRQTRTTTRRGVAKRPSRASARKKSNALRGRRR